MTPEVDVPETSGESLPLVLVTIGNSQEEFEVLCEHLDSVAEARIPSFQSLIVTKPDMPELLFDVLQSQAESMPHVHLHRLGYVVGRRAYLKHKAGTFIATHSTTET